MVRQSLFYAAAAFSVAALLLLGCQHKEEDKQQEEPTPEVDVYTDNFGPEKEQSYHPTWKAGESISVFSKTTENREFRFKGSDGDKTGSFEPVSEAGSKAPSLDAYYAASPYSPDNGISGSGVISLTLPQTQAYVEGGTDPAAQILAAKSYNHNFQFLNAGGVLAIQLKGRAGSYVSSITLQGNAEEKLSGPMEITIGGEGIHTTLSEEALTSITLKCAQPVELNPDSPTVFSFILPPVTLSNGITFTVFDQEGKECTVQTESRLRVRRGIITDTKVFDVRPMWQDVPDKLGIYPNYHHQGTPVIYTPGAMQTSVFEAEEKLWARFLEMASLRIYMLGPIPAKAAPGDVFEASFTVSEVGKEISSENLSLEVLDIQDGIITLLNGDDSYYIVRI